MDNLEQIAEDESEGKSISASPSKPDIRAHIQTESSESPEMSPIKVKNQKNGKNGDDDPDKGKEEFRRSFNAKSKKKWILIGILAALFSLTVTGILLYFFVFKPNSVSEEKENEKPVTPPIEGETEEERKAREEAERKKKEQEEADRIAA